MNVFTMHGIVVIAAVVLVMIDSCQSDPIDPPIPVDYTEPGIQYKPGPTQPKVLLEIFIELNCPYSEAGLPVVQQVADHYGSSQLDLTVHQLPLPYHRNGFLSTQGLYLINANLPETTFDYIEAVLAKNSDFSTANTFNKTEAEVLDMLADIAVDATGVDKTFFTSEIGNYRTQTVNAWKYAVKRNQAGTPGYSVNGVDLVGESPTFDDWIAFLDPIINAN
jgi:protein-disulfide isomerase